jgi:murein DD-endopeptidase MepM/ murein hydrolase activator NlpD
MQIIKVVFLTLLVLFSFSFQDLPEVNGIIKSFSLDDNYIKVPPTRTDKTLMRGAVGAFGANRGGGNSHAGVDIVANQSSTDKEIYAVFAIENGKVAYARLNGSDETGYGYTVVIDHGNNQYSQYSHLATRASENLVKVGDNISRGQKIGYLADLLNNEKSSGNVRSDVVMQYDKIQLHFECFSAPSGRVSNSSLAILKAQSILINPTQRLVSFGYSSF